MKQPTIRLAAFTLLIALGGVVGAEDFSWGPSFRADDGGVWHGRDNPALSGLGVTGATFAYEYAPLDASGQVLSSISAGSPGTFATLISTPFLSFEQRTVDDVSSFALSSALSFTPWLSFGYRYGWSSEDGSAKTVDLGTLLRPSGDLSLALTLSDLGSASPVFGGGVALRPFAFLGSSGSTFTLSADARSEAGSIVMESTGAHLRLGGIDLRGWWNFEHQGPGVELSLAIGPTESRLAMVNPGQDARDLRIGTSVSLASLRPKPAALGKKVVVIGGLDSFTGLPLPPRPLAFLFGQERSMDLATLSSVLERAASDPMVEAVAFEDLPTMSGFAYAQELGSTLQSFKKRGKPVYFFGHDYPSSGQYSVIASMADRVALDPNGSVALSGVSSRRLYLKAFLDRLGISFVNLAPWPTKSANNQYSYGSMPQEERTMMKRLVDELQSQISTALAAGRSGKITGGIAETVAAGPFLVATKAKDAGLVDDISYREEFESWIKKAHPGAALDWAYSSAASPMTWGPSAFSKRAVILNLSGAIVDDLGTPGSNIGTAAIGTLAGLRANPSIDAVILRIDSPGGSVSVSDRIAREVKILRDAGKLVVVSMGNYAASGGYYIAANADRIFAEPGTLTGSIGVTGAVPNIAEALHKLSLSSDGVSSSESSDFMDMAEPVRERDLALLKEKILATYDSFVSVVAKGRGLSEDGVRAIGEGQIWTGREALNRGLVDELGGLADAQRYVESRLGGSMMFEQRWPSLTPDAGPSLSAAAAKILSSSLPESRALSALRSAFGPYAKTLADLADMGSQPLLYAEGLDTIR